MPMPLQPTIMRACDRHAGRGMSQRKLQWRADQETGGAWRRGAGLHLRTVQARGAPQEQAGDWAPGAGAASQCHAAAGAGCSAAGGEQCACAAGRLGPVQQPRLIMPCRLTAHFWGHSVLRLSLQLAAQGPHACTLHKQPAPALQGTAAARPIFEELLAAFSGKGRLHPGHVVLHGRSAPTNSLPASLTCDDASTMLVSAANGVLQLAGPRRGRLQTCCQCLDRCLPGRLAGTCVLSLGGMIAGSHLLACACCSLLLAALLTATLAEQSCRHGLLAAPAVACYPWSMAAGAPMKLWGPSCT